MHFLRMTRTNELDDAERSAQDSMTDEPPTTIFPELTTTFTPDDEYMSCYFVGCERYCSAEGFPALRTDCGSNELSDKTRHGCYPKEVVTTNEKIDTCT